MKKIIFVLLLVVVAISIYLIEGSINMEVEETSNSYKNEALAAGTEQTIDFGLNDDSKIIKIESLLTLYLSNVNYFTVFLKDNGVVYIAGARVTSSSIPKRAPDNVNSGFVNGTVTDIATGEDHVLLLADGVVYSMGNNSGGQLGDETKTDSMTTVIKVKDNPDSGFVNENVDKISAGKKTSFIVKDGILYSFGTSVSSTSYYTNTRGSLGDGKDESERLLPHKVSDNIADGFRNGNVVDVSTGVNHTIILTEDNFVYSFGTNSLLSTDYTGKLGIDIGSSYSDAVNIPTKISSNDGFVNGSQVEGKEILSISAGWGHSLILLADGTAYAFGAGNDGRLGTENETDQSKPVKVALNNIVSIKAGAYASGFVTSDGKGYGAGDEYAGLIDWRQGSRTSTSIAEINVTPNSGIKEVLEFGGDAEQAVFVITEDGNYHALGNVSGGLGFGNSSTQSSFQLGQKVGAQFELTGTAIEHDNTENIEMKYTSDVTISGILRSGNAYSLGYLKIDGVDVTNTYDANGGSYTVSVAIGEEKEVSIDVRYSASSIINYKFIIDKKPPKLANLPTSCKAIVSVLYCNDNVSLVLENDISNFYSIEKYENEGEAPVNIDTENLTDNKIEDLTFDGEIIEKSIIKYTVVDGAGNTSDIYFILDNLAPRVKN